MTRHSFRSMGCAVVVAVDSGHERARALFEADDRRFTRFTDSSELARVNRASHPVLVSERFARAVRAALSAARQTAGLVDPTLLRALLAAGYDRDFADLRARPDPPAAGPRGCAAQVRLRGRLLELPAGAALDLNGVVKSMAVDDALAATGGRGWISAGGDVATTRPLEVELPGGDSIRLTRGALATSGSATRRWTRAGETLHHLIDPSTGRPSTSPWEQVTVSGATCLMADIGAKAGYLMGERGPDWLDRRGMAARFVRADGSVLVNETWSRSCT